MELDHGVNNLHAIEEVETACGKRLLERDGVRLVEASGLDPGITFDADVECLVVDEPRVELLERINVANGDVLSKVDPRMLVGVGRRKVQDGEGGLVRSIRKVHGALERLNVGLDSAVGADGGANVHGERVGRSISDLDRYDFKLCLVDLVLGDSRNSDEDSKSETISLLF